MAKVYNSPASLFAAAAVCILLLSNSVSAQTNYCKVLALTGGGARGSYQAGVLYAFTRLLQGTEIDYDVVAGVSAGTINALAAMAFDKGEEKEWVEFLLGEWHTIENGDVYEDWWFGEIRGLLLESGIYNNEPLRGYLSMVLNGLTDNTQVLTQDRKLVIGVTDASDGSRVLFYENSTFEKIIDAAVASAAIPGVFPVSVIDGVEYIDGGVHANIEIEGGIKRCLESGVDQHNILVDIVATSPLEPSASDKRFSEEGVVCNLVNAFEILMVAPVQRSIDLAKTSYPDVYFRYTISPGSKLPGSMIDFDSITTDELIDHGMKDAQMAIDGYISLPSVAQSSSFWDDLIEKLSNVLGFIF